MKQPHFFLFVLLVSSLLVSTLLISTKSFATTKPPIQKGIVYHPVDNISDYWVSEKLDGVRGYWNGHQLFTKQGHLINAPIWFTQYWPNQAIDGELWIARNTFAQVSSIVRKQHPNDKNWHKIHLMMFDLPSASGNFSQRIKQMQTLIKHTKSSTLKMIAQHKATTVSHLFTQLDNIVKHHGEGLMLHYQNAFYKAGRVSHLMKLKKYQDAEATVIAYIPGKGKYIHMLGAITVKTFTGVTFNIGSGFSDQQRKNPPPIGATITYKYFGKTKNGVPRFASFMRIRKIW